MRYMASSRLLQAATKRFVGITMDDGHKQINASCGHPQSPSTRARLEISNYLLTTSTRLEAPLYLSDYASPGSKQSGSSPESYQGDHRLVARQELNGILTGSLALSTPRHNSQSSSRPSFRTLSSQGSASDGRLRYADLSPGPVYNFTIQPILSQNNIHIESQHDDREWQLNQPASWLSPSPFCPISPEASSIPARFIAQPESAVQDNLLSNWSNNQATSSLGFEYHQSLINRQSTTINFPSTCYGCHDQSTIYQNLNVFQLHYWTEHPPPTGSPDAWSPRKCLWEGCHLPKDFGTSRGWINHAYDVHHKRYRCNVFGCSVRPFGTQAMVERHYRTKHIQPRFCTKAGCQARKGSNLCRKDKLDEHDAKWHGPLMCKVADCPRRRIEGEDHGFSKQSELDEHMKRKHRHLQF
jgi:hypothetical protein